MHSFVGLITPRKIPKQEIYQNHFTQYSAFIILLLQAKKLEKVNALVIDQTWKNLVGPFWASLASKNSKQNFS